MYKNRNFYFTDTNSCIKINRNIFSGYFKSIERKNNEQTKIKTSNSKNVK